ncbi:MAG: hypothetical protein ACJ745_01280 [Actinomycetes bacterium]
MNTTSISIRTTGCDDYVALWSIAALDSATVPAEPLLVAEEDGAIVAALSLTSGEAIADPFRRSAPAVALLRLRAAQHAGERAPRHGLLGRLRTRAAFASPAQ